MSKQPFRDYDSPNRRQYGGEHYIVPPTRDPVEAIRRIDRPRGVLRFEYQQRGLRIGATVLRGLHEPEDVEFARPVLAASLQKAGDYTSNMGRIDVQRSRWKLPDLTEASPLAGLPLHVMLRETAAQLEEAAMASDKLINGLSRHDTRIKRTGLQVGGRIGHASLTLSAAHLAGIGYLLSDFDIQWQARIEGLKTAEKVGALAETIGTIPSIAQLADPDSPLSVYWRREAPNGAYEALEMAVAA
jgi:hypothetical protein